MSSPLAPQRKQELASGLLRAYLILFLIKLGLLLHFLSTGPPGKMLLIGVAMLGASVGMFFLARWSTRHPARARWGIALPVLISLVEIFGVLRLLRETPWIGAIALVNALLVLLAGALLWSGRQTWWSVWAEKFPRGAKVLRIFALLALLFGILELGLRNFQFQPGYLYRMVFFQEVNELQLRKDYWADESGLFVWSPEAVRFLNGQIAAAPMRMDFKAVETNPHFSDYEFYQDYVDFHAGRVDNPFRRMITEIGQKPGSLRTEVERAYYHQAFHPLNADGFRSIAFRPFQSTRRKILLIGDSFTWGHSAGNFTSGFADRLAATGDIVYNAGISGTDPAQYAALARKYIPRLQPDIVVVNFFMGNDILYFQRPVQPHQLMQYHTNAGNLLAYPGPERLETAQAAYDFVKAEMQLPVTGLFSRLCASTCVTTLLWRGLRRIGWIKGGKANAAYWERNANQISETPVSGVHLKAIRKLCAAHQAQFVLAVIPDLEALDRPIPDGYPGLFDGLDIAVPQVDASDYDASDAHFNAQGHRKYADFLLREMK